MGKNPSLASIYRALAEYENAQAYPEAVAAARTEYAALAAATDGQGLLRPRPARVLDPVDTHLREPLQEQVRP